MAKPKNSKGTVVNVALLQSIASGQVARVSQEEFATIKDFAEANGQDVVDGKAAVRLTDAGNQYLANLNSGENKDKPMFNVMKGFVPPPSQRGNKKGAGAPTQYPFATMELGEFFFVGNSQKPDAAKKLMSTVSQFNMKYRTETGETEQVERTKRGEGNKAVLDSEGKKVKETVTVKKYKQDRKFIIRAVKGGEKYGEWTAPEDGAAIMREM